MAVKDEIRAITTHNPSKYKSRKNVPLEKFQLEQEDKCIP